MATTTSRLQLVIAGDNKGAAHAIDDTGKRIGGLQGKLGGLGAGIAGAFSVGAVVAFGKQSVSAYQDIAGQVAAIKRITGDTAEGASLLAFAAQQSGVDAAKASVGWRTLAKNIDAGKVAAEGIATSEGNGRLLTFDQILGNVADKIQALPPGFQRTALAQRLFGRSGADMVKILQNGRQGIEDLRQEMQSYGLEFSDAGLKKYTEFVKAQRDMKAAVTGVQVEVGQRVVPVMTKFAESVAFFGRLPGPVKAAATGIAGLTLTVGGLNLAYGLLQPIWDRGFISMVRNATGSASLAAAETLAAEAAAAEAAATQALTTALLAAGPAEAEFAAAASARASASAAAATASEAQAAATGGVGLASTGLLAAAGLATGGVVVLGAAMVQAAGDADRAKANVAALQSQLEQGVDPNDIFKKQLQATLSGVDGGFQLDISGDTFRRAIADIGISAKELNDLLIGPQKEWDAFILKVSRDQGVGSLAVGQLRSLRAAGQDAVATQKEQDRIGKDLGVTTEDTADATGELADKTDDLRTATEKANDWAEKAISNQKGLTDAREAAVDATRASERADYELAIARQEAAGNSEEYRDAEKEVRDALAAVPEAQREVQDSLEALNDARQDAADRLRDMAQAERDAALASADAQLKVKEALNEQRRVNANPNSTPLEKERAALAVEQARNDARNAADDAAKAARDNAEAQRKGIEGDDAVVRAKQAVRDANDGVRDAVNRVRDAEANAAKVIQDAKAKVLEAQEASTDAALTEAQAWGDLVEKQYGSVAGLQAYRDELKKLAADLDPNSPLAQRLARLIEDINTALASATSRPASEQPNGGQTGTIGYYGGISGDAPAPASPGGDARGGGTGGNVTVYQTNINQGTPHQQRVAQEQATHRVMNDVARRQR